MIAMRCAGFDRVDIQTAKALGIRWVQGSLPLPFLFQLTQNVP